VSSWNFVALLPGIYVLLLALGLVACLKGWGERLSGLAWLSLFAAVFAPLAPVLFGGQLLLPLDNLRGAAPFLAVAPAEPHGNPLQGDLIQLIAPLSQAVEEDLGAGRWPLWNAHMGAGMPLLADPQAQPFQPLALLAYPFPLAVAAGVTAALRILLAVVFFALLLRRQGLSEGPAVAGALAYGLGGFLQLWLGWPLANTAAWLPVVLWAASRCLAQPDRRQEAVLTFCLLGLLLAGHPETILYALLFSTGFVLTLLGREEPQKRRAAGHRLAICAGLSLLLAAPVLLPFAQYLPQTWRALTLESPSLLPPPSPAQALLPTVAPNTFGNSRYVHYWGFRNSNEDASGFAGTATLLLALGAVWLGRRKRMPGEVWALAVVGGVGLFLALGSWTAAVSSWMFHGGGRLRMLLPFGLAYLAACGLHRARREPPRRAVLVLASLALALVLLWAFEAFRSPGGEDQLAVLRYGWLLWQLRFLAAALLLLLFASARRWQPWLMALLIGAELFLAHGDANPPMPQRLAWPHSAVLDSLPALADGEWPRLVALGPALPPNLGALYGFEDPRIYDPMEPAAYASLVAPLLAQPRGNVPQAVARDHPLYDLLGIEFVLVAPGEPPLPPPLRLLAQSAEGSVYRRPHPLPPVFLPSRVRSLAGSPWQETVATTEDFHRLAWVEALAADDRAAAGPGSAGGPREWQPAQGCPSSARVLERTGARLLVQAELCEQRLLASRFFAGQGNLGWRLLVDGRPWPVERTNGVFLGAWLPEGRHWLEFFFRPSAFLAGVLLAAFGFALGLCRWLAPPGTLRA
jgi:hypothetical protein